MPDTLALNVNSRVRVADVYVGRVRSIELKNWVATLTLDLEPDVKLPENALAKIGQTSLLGSQHVQLDPPPDPSPQQLKNGDTIPLKNSLGVPDDRADAGQHRHRSCAAAASPNLEVIQTEVNNLLTGRADQIREFLNRLDTFTDELNQQRTDITRAIDSTNRLLSIVGQSHQHPRPGADRIPAADQAFRRHPGPVRRRRRVAGPDQQRRRRRARHRRAPTCTPTCRTCSGR